jgi:hypothetical protein
MRLVTASWTVETTIEVQFYITDEQYEEDFHHDAVDGMQGTTNLPRLNEHLATKLPNGGGWVSDVEMRHIRGRISQEKLPDWDGEPDNSAAVEMQERSWDTLMYGN